MSVVSLAEHIAVARMDALRARDSATVTSLGTVLGEAKQIATKKENREPTDEEVLGVIKKTLEGIGEMLKLVSDMEVRAPILIEQALLQKYMPTQLSEIEINTIIENAALDNLGKIMALFKINYAGKYDGKVVKASADRYLEQLK